MWLQGENSHNMLHTVRTAAPGSCYQKQTVIGDSSGKTSLELIFVVSRVEIVAFVVNTQ